jgi:hypothetical protein
MQQRNFTNTELIEMLKVLHKDNERDTVCGIREDVEFISLKRIHERNNMIHMILSKVSIDE